MCSTIILNAPNQEGYQSQPEDSVIQLKICSSCPNFLLLKYLGSSQHSPSLHANLSLPEGWKSIAELLSEISQLKRVQLRSTLPFIFNEAV